MRNPIYIKRYFEYRDEENPHTTLGDVVKKVAVMAKEAMTAKKAAVMAKEAMTAKAAAVRLCLTEGIGGARSRPHHHSAAPPHYAASWSFLQAVSLSQAMWREPAVSEAVVSEMAYGLILYQGEKWLGLGWRWFEL
jgi:hypothetical protein